jgi:hypothetical protein
MSQNRDPRKDPRLGDRWRKGGHKWAREGCDLTIDRWDGTSGVFSQCGLISKMFLCNWDANMLYKFNKWTNKLQLSLSNDHFLYYLC